LTWNIIFSGFVFSLPNRRLVGRRTQVMRGTRTKTFREAFALNMEMAAEHLARLVPIWRDSALSSSRLQLANSACGDKDNEAITMPYDRQRS